MKILDHRNRDNILDVLGKPLAFRELSRDELPTDLLKEYPEATGGEWALLGVEPVGEEETREAWR